MQRHFWTFIFSFILSPLAYGLELPAENSLATLLVNQKDALFYEMNVIPQGQQSSLCGPTSAINWLQLTTQNQPYQKTDLVQLVKEVAADLRKQNIDINNGLIEPDLVKFLSTLNRKLGLSKKYSIIGRYGGIPLENEFWNDRAQILLFEYKEIPPAPRFPGRGGRNIPLPDELMDHPLIQGYHFVLKVAANLENHTLIVIDPESPELYTTLQVATQKVNGEIYFRPASRKDLSAFSFGVPMKWTLRSLIEEK